VTRKCRSTKIAVTYDHVFSTGPLWGLKFPRFPESDFKNLGALVAAAARLSAAVLALDIGVGLAGDLLCSESVYPIEVVVVAQALHEKNAR
jgi:hypothetical protein